MRIDTTPIKDFIVKGFMATGPWNQWLSSVGEALQGDWLNSKKVLQTSGITGAQLNSYNMIRGQKVSFECEFENVVVSSGSITLPYNVKDTILNCFYYDTQWNCSPVELVDNVISIPNMTASRLIVKGDMFKNIIWGGE